jgi:hypothetical protein
MDNGVPMIALDRQSSNIRRLFQRAVAVSHVHTKRLSDDFREFELQNATTGSLKCKNCHPVRRAADLLDIAECVLTSLE